MSKHSSTGTEWNKLRQQVLARDNAICHYCGREATTADHVIAKANGGRDELSNLVAACLRCNGIKSDKTLTRLNYVNKKWLTSL